MSFIFFFFFFDGSRELQAYRGDAESALSQILRSQVKMLSRAHPVHKGKTSRRHRRPQFLATPSLSQNAHHKTLGMIIKAQVQFSCCVGPCHVELALGQVCGTRVLEQTVFQHGAKHDRGEQSFTVCKSQHQG